MKILKVALIASVIMEMPFSPASCAMSISDTQAFLIDSSPDVIITALSMCIMLFVYLSLICPILLNLQNFRN